MKRLLSSRLITAGQLLIWVAAPVAGLAVAWVRRTIDFGSGLVVLGAILVVVYAGMVCLAAAVVRAPRRSRNDTRGWAWTWLITYSVIWMLSAFIPVPVAYDCGPGCDLSWLDYTLIGSNGKVSLIEALVWFGPPLALLLATTFAAHLVEPDHIPTLDRVTEGLG